METFFLGLGILLLCIIINILFDISNDIIEGLLSIIKFVGYTFVCVGAYQYYTDIKHYVNEEKIQLQLVIYQQIPYIMTKLKRK